MFHVEHFWVSQTVSKLFHVEQFALHGIKSINTSHRYHRKVEPSVCFKGDSGKYGPLKSRIATESGRWATLTKTVNYFGSNILGAFSRHARA